MNREEYKQNLLNKDDGHYKGVNEIIPSFINDLVDENIFCPHCGEIQSNDDGQYPVTYWGHSSEEDTDKECDSCGEKFFIKESVTRTYETRKTEEEEE